MPTSWEPKFYMLYVLYWTANFPSDKALYEEEKNCPQSQIIENIYVCKRAERASFEKCMNLLLYIIMHNDV